MNSRQPLTSSSKLVDRLSGCPYCSYPLSINKVVKPYIFMGKRSKKFWIVGCDHAKEFRHAETEAQLERAWNEWAQSVFPIVAKERSYDYEMEMQALIALKIDL